MKAGAVDFIEKPFDQEAILHAVQAALERGSGGDGGDGPAIAAKLASLSERERQVLDGLIAGHPNKIIAHDLGISPRTVEVYRANLMTKMAARSLSELIRMAILADIAPARRAREIGARRRRVAPFDVAQCGLAPACAICCPLRSAKCARRMRIWRRPQPF